MIRDHVESQDRFGRESFECGGIKILIAVYARSLCFQRCKELGYRLEGRPPVVEDLPYRNFRTACSSRGFTL